MQLQLLHSNPNLFSPNQTPPSSLLAKLAYSNFSAVTRPSARISYSFAPPEIKLRSETMSSIVSSAVSDRSGVVELAVEDSELDRFAVVANKLADASGEVIRKYFRKSFDILDKEDLSPVTIADQAAEEAMVRIIQESFPSHAIYGEEDGWKCKDKVADFVWVLDPIDGTKSFITGFYFVGSSVSCGVFFSSSIFAELAGAFFFFCDSGKPLFGTLIALLHKGKPVLGIIDQPILRERWIGLSGRKTTLNGQEISTRSCAKLSQAYLYTTSPHLFKGDADVAFARVRDKPYDFLSLIPVIEGAGGVITDWKGHSLNWKASADAQPASFNVVAAGDKQLHSLAIGALQWD
ncbi:OLC1v1000147C3 [Oldenlandia corymbosa var. corymbosa]|uniref:OLC1v1000147C3 n=1 Tax=Oldenlandia corymbosa var. corymbosa TaxID=529605 RepID=A0AAV1D267_OLDCO|nr:OLC1v1000147C3 [Oldenlandia corymbosa var. corymbosa]